jgi:hypothetical protein
MARPGRRDSRPQNTCRTHQQSTQTGNDAICRSQIASPLPTTIQNQDLVSHQDGFGNYGTEPARSTKSDNDDDRMQKKSENVAHAEDGIRLKKFKNSGTLRNSPPTPAIANTVSPRSSTGLYCKDQSSAVLKNFTQSDCQSFLGPDPVLTVPFRVDFGHVLGRKQSEHRGTINRLLQVREAVAILALLPVEG